MNPIASKLLRALEEARRREGHDETPAPDTVRIEMEDGFLALLRERPYDHDTRLVYADWLEEQGDHDRALFLRVQAGAGANAAHELSRVVHRIDESWRACVHEREARRHPLWLAAALGSVAARDELATYAPRRLVDTPESVRTGDAFVNWPAPLLARLALAAARRAIAAMRRPSDPEADRSSTFLDRIDADLARPFADRASLESEARALVVGRNRLGRPEEHARWSATTALQYVARTLGPYHSKERSEPSVVDATVLVITHVIDTVGNLAWAVNDTRKLHQRATHYERIAAAAVERADRWEGSHVGALARATHEGWNPDERRASIQKQQHRSRAVATARTAAAELARAACPPEPPVEAITRELILAICDDVLPWLATQHQMFPSDPT